MDKKQAADCSLEGSFAGNASRASLGGRRIGQLAISQRLLRPADVLEVLSAQTLGGGYFGETAVALGLLPPDKVEELLALQASKARVPVEMRDEDPADELVDSDREISQRPAGQRCVYLQSTLETLNALTSDSQAATSALQYLAKASDKVDVEVVASMIETDAAIAARFLRLANSAVFGVRATVGTVKAAIMLLGVEATKHTLASSLFLVPRKDRHVLLRTEVWTKSLRGACWAKAIAALENPRDHTFGGAAFTAGLLRDIGQLVLLDRFPEALMRIDARVADGEALNEAELAEVGLSHEDIGAYLARAWAFPKAIVEAIWFHHLRAEMEECAFVDSMTNVVRRATQLAEYDFAVLLADSEMTVVRHWTNERPEHSRVLLEQASRDFAQSLSLIAAS